MQVAQIAIHRCSCNRRKFNDAIKPNPSQTLSRYEIWRMYRIETRNWQYWKIYKAGATRGRLVTLRNSYANGGTYARDTLKHFQYCFVHKVLGWCTHVHVNVVYVYVWVLLVAVCVRVYASGCFNKWMTRLEWCNFNENWRKCREQLRSRKVYGFKRSLSKSIFGILWKK